MQDDGTMDYKAAYERGIAQFNDGDYFACHDTIEEIWMETRGQHRRYLQGLIQIAVGIYHGISGNMRGADNMLGKALDKLKDYPGVYYGVNLTALFNDTEILQQSVRLCLQSDSNAFDTSLIPAIGYTPVEQELFAGW